MERLIIKLSGEIQSTNFSNWKKDLIGQIQSTNLDLITAEDFAIAEKQVKSFKSAEKLLKEAKTSAINQAMDIQQLFDAIDEISEQARQARLNLEKQIKDKKIQIKNEIADEGIEIILAEIEKQNDDFKLTDNSNFIDKSAFLSKISRTKGVAGAKAAIQLLCGRYKEKIKEKAAQINHKALILDSMKVEHVALFQDRGYVLSLPFDDFDKVIDSRIKTFEENSSLSKNKTTPINDSNSLSDESQNKTKENFHKQVTTSDLSYESIQKAKNVLMSLIRDNNDEEILFTLSVCLKLLDIEESKLQDKP